MRIFHIHIGRYSTFTYGSYINGQWLKSPETIRVISPATEATLAHVSRASAKEMQLAVSSGLETFKSGVWSQMDSSDRFRILVTIANGLRTNLNEYAHYESLQTGRPIAEMNAQLSRLPEWLEYFASLCRTVQGTIPQFKGDMVNMVQDVPIGVVGQITPWNHPLLIAIKKLAPAIAAGNSVVIKPSELAPVNVLKFAQLCVESGCMKI